FLSTGIGLGWKSIYPSATTDTNISTIATDGSTLIAAGPSGVYLSTNTGSQWTLQKNIEWPGIPVNAITLKSSNLIAGNGLGIYRSTDDGISWMQSSLGLPHPDLIAFTSSGPNLFAGTYGY